MLIMVPKIDLLRTFAGKTSSWSTQGGLLPLLPRGGTDERWIASLVPQVSCQDVVTRFGSLHAQNSPCHGVTMVQLFFLYGITVGPCPCPICSRDLDPFAIGTRQGTFIANFFIQLLSIPSFTAAPSWHARMWIQYANHMCQLILTETSAPIIFHTTTNAYFIICKGTQFFYYCGTKFSYFCIANVPALNTIHDSCTYHSCLCQTFQLLPYIWCILLWFVSFHHVGLQFLAVKEGH